MGVDGEKFLAHRTAGEQGLYFPTLWQKLHSPWRCVCANRASTLLVNPGSALGSKITLGMPLSQVASNIGPAA